MVAISCVILRISAWASQVGFLVMTSPWCLHFRAWTELYWKLLYRIICVGVLAVLIPDAPCSFCTMSVQFLRYFCWVIFTQILELLIGFCFGINSIKYLGKSATPAVLCYYWVYRFCNHSEKPIRTKESLLIYYPWVNGFWILCQGGGNASRLKRKGRLNLHLAVTSDFLLQLINNFSSSCENI